MLCIDRPFFGEKCIDRTIEYFLSCLFISVISLARNVSPDVGPC